MWLRVGAAWACLSAVCGVAHSAIIHSVLPAPANAQGVYRLNQFGQPDPHTAGTIDIDLDRNGIADFRATSDLAFPLSFANVNGLLSQGVTPVGSVLVDPTSLGAANPFALALNSGDSIGPAGTWLDGGVLLAESDRGGQRHTTGNTLWQDQAGHYVGLRLTVDGTTHYGWLGVAVGITPLPTTPPPFDDPHLTTYSLRVTDWAYETTADAPIAAGAVPEPAAGVAFLAGAGLLGVRRRSRGR